MSVVPKTKVNSATTSSWFRKISQHRLRSTTQNCTECAGGPMGNQQWRTSTRHKMVEWKRGERKSDTRNGYKLLWDWEHRMRTTNMARWPDLTLEDESKKIICIVDMACPCELNIHEKKIEKLQKYEQLAFKLRKRREQYRVTVLPLVMGCLGGGIKQLTKDINVSFKPEDLNSI